MKDVFGSEIMQLKEELLKMISEECPDLEDKDLQRIQIKLNESSVDNLYRLHDTFYRFGVKTILDLVGEGKINEHNTN